VLRHELRKEEAGSSPHASFSLANYRSTNASFAHPGLVQWAHFRHKYQGTLHHSIDRKKYGFQDLEKQKSVIKACVITCPESSIPRSINRFMKTLTELWQCIPKVVHLVITLFRDRTECKFRNKVFFAGCI
jgi:hypothetical protein